MCGDEKDQLVKCVYDDVEYYEGSSIYIRDTCSTCTCDEKFNASDPITHSNCRQVKCNTVFSHAVEISQGCAPVFYLNSCCPFHYRCRKCCDMGL